MSGNTEATSSKNNDSNGDLSCEKPQKNWVKFDDETPQTNNVKSETNAAFENDTGRAESSRTEIPAVLTTETIQVNIDREKPESIPQYNINIKNVEVNNRHGFSNGDIIVTLLPVNTKWPWITAASFKPELVPEELMAQGLTLTVEEYVHAMELLVNDARFTMYNICYKRVLICWITIAFLVLLTLLFSGLTGLTLFSLGVVWLVLNALAIFLCMWIKLRLSKGLEQCLATVNKLLNKHKLLLALDDRGKISCHKVHLCFIYFDSGPCITHLQQFIESEEGRTIMEGWEQRLDVSANDIVIQGSQSTRLSRKQCGALFFVGTFSLACMGPITPVDQIQSCALSGGKDLYYLLTLKERGALLYLRYIGRWGTYVVKKRLNLDRITPGRHGDKYVCPCQYIEEHLKTKPPAGLAKFFSLPNQNNSVYY